MKERNQQLDQARAQIKAECWDSMDVHHETVSALKAPLKVRTARCWACVCQCRVGRYTPQQVSKTVGWPCPASGGAVHSRSLLAKSHMGPPTL